MPHAGGAVPLDRTLDELAALASIRGSAGETKIFRDAAALVRSQRIQSDADLEPLLAHPPAGTSADVLNQLRYMFDAGAWVLLESAIADLPADLRWLFESGAVTIEQIVGLYEALGVMSAADLGAELKREAIRHVPGFDARLEAAVRAALPTLRAAIPRVPLGRAYALLDPVLSILRDAGIPSAQPVGSLRRGQDSVGDIEVVAPADDPSAAIDAVLRLPDLARTLHRGARRVYLLTDRVQIGVRFPRPAEAGAALLHLTGSTTHLEQLAAVAAERRALLEPEGLLLAGRAAHVAESEEAIYEALGLPWIPPEIRNGDGEMEAARTGRMPTLVSRTDIRGDLHMHSLWSDGRDPIEAMVKTSVALGYEYIAITDHSQSAAAARTLSADAIGRQADEITELRARYPQLAILHGCEVDILADGTLDFPDRLLERFDIVLASLHERHGHEPDELLARYLTAMRHPLVTVITHPTNRMIPYRRGYELDYDRLFAAAVETGTVLEIDGAPPHLDMDAPLARRAIAAGVTVSIDSDCHRAEMLDRQMTLGLLTARRAWVEPRHVLNARPLAEVRRLIAAKRGR